MELNLSTFLLEIVNFLVLVWILKRFFYKPVLDVIQRRKQDIDARLAESHRMQDEAEKLHSQYENRIADWERERDKAREELVYEIDQERTRKLNELQQELAQEREKQAVIDQKNLQKQHHEYQLRALRQGAQFSALLLSQGAGPETQARLVEILLEELQQLDEAKIARIREQWGEPVTHIHIVSAFPISDAQKQMLENTLRNLTASTLPPEYSQDDSLIAGISIAIGSWTLSMNLHDELKSFAEFHNEPG